MDTFVDYYELLHVQPTAPEPVIKASYRAMLQKLNHHPDRGGDVAFAQLLNAAAQTLCNPKARKHYDQLRQQQQANRQTEQPRGDNNKQAWGDAGGTPTGGQKRSANADSTADQNTQHAKQRAHTEQRGKQAGTALNSLPAKPQCPFCLSPYAQAHNLMAKGYTNKNRCQTCNAARTPIAQVPLSSNDELRRMHRHRHETPAQLWPSWPIDSPVESFLTDFSPTGCALQCSQKLTNDQVIMLETQLFNAVCTVRHCQPALNKAYIIGAEFITLDMIARPGTLLIANA